MKKEDVKSNIKIINLILSSLLIFNLLFNHLKSNSVFATQPCILSNSDDKPNNDFGKTFFAIRPQDSNSARRITRTKDRLELFYPSRRTIEKEDITELLYKKFNVKIDLALEYQASFGSKLGKWFSVNNNNCMSFGITGSQSFDIDGTQLGLSARNNMLGSIGKFCIKPKIQNFIMDFDFQFNLDLITKKLWARIDLPFVIARTKLGLNTFNDTAAAFGSFPLGLFSLDCTETQIAYHSIASALNGDLGFGAVPALDFGRFSNHWSTKFNVAGIHIDLGYDFLRTKRCHFGMSLHVVTPTGTNSSGRFIFEPVIGANRCWQLGTNISASYNFYNNIYNERKIYFVFDATLTHLFKSKQSRLFSLKNNGAGSQFLLLKRFNAIGSALIGADRVANVLIGETKIGSDVMFDGAAMFKFNSYNLFGNIGYNLWFRSKEKRSKTVCFRNFAENTLAIKGNLPLSEPQLSGTCNLPPCMPNMSTSSKSTIGNPAPADDVNTFIGINDIDFGTPLNPSALSNKIFASIGYNFNFSQCNWEILLAGEVEFGYKRSALNQWGIMLIFGIAI